MAEKVIRVCDWSHEEDVEATHSNKWRDLNGHERKNDLCDEHQAVFLQLWEQIETGSQPAVSNQASSKASSASKRRGPTTRALVKAWLESQGRGGELKGTGRPPFHLEQEWINAGRPDYVTKSPS